MEKSGLGRILMKPEQEIRLEEDMKENEIRDESLLEVNGGKWTLETLTPEERDEFMRVSQELTDNWNYVEYNDFIRRMNEKYGK